MSSRNSYAISWRKLLWMPFALAMLLMSWASQATEPVQIGFTLEGCRLETGATYDQTTFTCTDEGYVTGNLGKQWNELDYVPHRVTLHNGNGAQTFDFIVAGDYTPNSVSTVGWDDITELTLNTALSDGTCNPVVSGPVSITPPGDGAGGAYETIYREIEATMAAGETCVYDYAQRLSLGASEFSGSSLQSNLWNEFFANSNIGQKRIQLPVADILPQDLNKDMNAQQDTVYIWNLTKTATPSDLSFQNSCERDDPMTETTTIRIEWQRLPGESGMVTVVTNIYAYNPAHLDVHVSVTDRIYGNLGSGEVLLGTASADDVLVPAGDTVKLLTHTIPDVDPNVYGLNDIAHATYKIGEIEVPGQTDAFASAEVQPSGNEVDATSVITDVEGPISGLGYMFSVDSVDGSGDFTDGYTLGSMTAGSVSWASTEQTGDGYVEFVKTIYLDEPRDSQGELPDTATLQASNGYSVSKNASVTFADYPLVELTIHKSIDLTLDDGESASFFFDVYQVVEGDDDLLVAENVEIGFGPGELSNHVVVGNLDPNQTYRVVEVSGSDGFTLDSEQQASILLPICGGDVYFVNEAEPAKAKAIKVTVPASESPAGFEFLLTGPGLGAGVAATSDGDGNAFFSADLFEGEYTITELPREGWELTDVSGGESNSVAGAYCTFTVNLPESADYEFYCTFENTKLATIIITKVVEGNNALNLAGDFYFDSSVGSFDALLAAQSWHFDSSALSGDSVSHTFTNLSPGSYDVTEMDPTLSLFSLTDISCTDPTADSSTGGFTANIALAAGETVECTFTNTKLAAPGNLIIYKTTIGDIGSFDYVSADGSLPPFSLATLSENTPTTGPQATFLNLEPGVYNLNEVVPTGWDLTGLYCVDDREIYAPTTWDQGTAAVSVSIDDAETVECYFENTKRGKVLVDKVTYPSGDEQYFDFTSSFGPFELQDASPLFDSGLVVPGIYNVAEVGEAGWDLTNYYCSDGSDPSAIDLAPGENVTCTFENTKRGKVLVDKVTYPSGDEQYFDFTSSFGPFELQDASPLFDSGLVVPGIYNVAEVGEAGWDLTNYYCSDGSDPSAIDLAPGETVTCTFENTKRGQIIITKVVEGNNALNLAGDFYYDSGVGSFDAMLAAQSWHFDSSALSGDSVSHAFMNLLPGSYDVTEMDPTLSLFSLTDISCTDPTGDSSTGGFTANIELAPGETVECTFTNTKLAAPGNLIIYKTTIGDTGSFDYMSADGTLPPFSLATLSENTPTTGPQATFLSLEPGVYSLNEMVPAGWDLTDLYCVDDREIFAPTTWDQGTASVSVSIDDAETVECYFENTKRGYIIVDKVTDPAGDLQEFGFNPDYADPFFLADASTPHMSDALVYGIYSVSETVPDGWDLTDSYCSDGSDPSAIDLQPGETVTCTFENTKRGMAEVLKTVSGIAPNGLYPVFNFQILSGGSAVAEATSDAITGFATFSCVAGADPSICVDVGGMAKLVPGDYEFCELDVQPGWTLTGSGNEGLLTWYSWSIGEDYMGECAAFMLSPDETEQFDVDNTPPPGGKAHTIGFWKNWTSCDGKGNQYDRWLTDPEFYNILDEFLPIYLHPEMEVNLCAVGVDILDKRDYADPAMVGDGSKNASDAAYGLAAQLMAVQLNIAAEAAVCPELMDAKVAAEQLLVEIGFTGTGDYLSKPKGTDRLLAQEAKYLAGILDSYNNNLLCPFVNGD
ncbi:prealbumin-like fold domain-containing protein [Marinobacterium sediminicola]|nr:hypothetical protein [Marinobacterium sediminicola]ULG68419.1 hypothetical protein LN244_12025 [Marinobacterium sediminicola]